MKKKKRSGFTLVELLAVVVILGVTFMFVLPKMVGLISDSEDKEIELIEERVLSAAKDYVNHIDGSFYIKLYKEGDTNYIYKTDLIKAGLIEEEEINKLDTLGGVKGELLSNDKIKYTVEYINASPSEYTNEELYLMYQNMNDRLNNLGSGGSGSGGNVDSSAIDDLQSQINTTNDKIDNLTNKSNNDNIFLKTYPVGSIYISNTNTNPGNTFGGTWVSFGTGRTLVGVDSNQTEFATVEKTGGEKTHTLINDEMPIHKHEFITSSTSKDLTGRVTFGAAVNTSDTSSNMSNIVTGATGVFNRETTDMTAIYVTAGTKTVNGIYRILTFDATHTHSGFTESVGGSQSHNNLQPYITVYMWKRTA